MGGLACQPGRPLILLFDKERSGAGVLLGMVNGMLGLTHPEIQARTGLMSRMLVPLKADRCRNVPSSCLKKPIIFITVLTSKEVVSTGGSGFVII